MSDALSEQHANEEAPVVTGPSPVGEIRRGDLAFFERSIFDDLWVQVGVAFVVIMVLFPFLGSFGLWDPWEVHYGEVGRQMVERGDWISPWWGSHWTAPDKAPEGEYFFSKPVLLLWMMGIGTQVFGFSDIAIRFGVALVAATGVFFAYRAGSRIWSRRVGILMAVTLLTSPFYFMLGRQAQADMPFVGMLTAALCCFMMGVFSRDRSEKVDRVSWLLFCAFLLLLVVPQLQIVTVGQWEWHSERKWYVAFWQWGGTHLIGYLLLLSVFFVSVFLSKRRTRGQLYLFTFYVFVGLATMGKGMMGFMLPGGIIFLYILVSRDWGLLKRAEIPRGVLLAVVVGFPWYGAMFARHGGIGGAFWNRFIVHDHFKRLASGVHQTDTGSFEHFIRQLGYGLFPWGSFVPAIIARAFAPRKKYDERELARLFLFIWFLAAYSLFTLSSTKFHHYIFPAVPPLAFLAALFLDDLISGKVDHRVWWPLYVAALALFVLVGFDLAHEPQNLKNMFTYRYDRKWRDAAWDPGLSRALLIFVLTFGVGMVLLARVRLRRAVAAGVVVLSLTGFAFAEWTLNHYMPTIASTWSQKGLFDAYYDACTPTEGPPGAHPIKNYCVESVISYKLNWRGETYYTQNEVVPIRDDDEWNFFVEQNAGRCFYGIMEHSRIGGFRSALPQEQRASVREVATGHGLDELGELDHELHLEYLNVIGTSNLKFALVSANCDEEAPADHGAGDGEEEQRGEP